jgi:hypothetical protein
MTAPTEISMNWDDLRFLVVIGREGTLGRGPQPEGGPDHRGPPPAGLEEPWAPPVRAQRGRWHPTPVGARVLARSTRIEEDVAGVVRLAEAGNRAVSGLVRITAVSAIIGEYLVPRLPGLYARHPDLAVELIASNDNLSVARRRPTSPSAWPARPAATS